MLITSSITSITLVLSMTKAVNTTGQDNVDNVKQNTKAKAK